MNFNIDKPNPSKPEELRSLLIECAKSVVDNRITVQQANAVAGLSAEIHKSIKMEYVGQVISSGHFKIKDGELFEYKRSDK